LSKTLLRPDLLRIYTSAKAWPLLRLSKRLQPERLISLKAWPLQKMYP